MHAPQHLTLPGGERLAYHRLEGHGPTVLFLGGFNSNMNGSKALALEAFCRARGQAFLRFDYTGHGESSGRFTDGAIGDWKRDALAVFDALTQGPVLLVGSSMGAWLALLVARERQARVAAILTLAAAPDFTEALIWQQLSDTQRREMQEQGVIHLPSCYGSEAYPITRRLVEEGREHLLLGAAIPIACPVRLIHGTKDEDVPWQHSVTLMERLQSQHVQLTLIKDGDHRLSNPEQLAVMTGVLGELVLQSPRLRGE